MEAPAALMKPSWWWPWAPRRGGGGDKKMLRRGVCLDIINISDHCLPSQRASLRGSCRKANLLPPSSASPHPPGARMASPCTGAPVRGSSLCLPPPTLLRLRCCPLRCVAQVRGTHATCPTPAQGTRPQPDAVPGCAGHRAGGGRPSLLCSGAEQTPVLGRDVIRGFVRSSLCLARGISRAAAGLLQINAK